MTMTAIEALATLRYSTKPEDVQHNSERIKTIRAALTAETQGVVLEWVKEGARSMYLLVNDHIFRRFDNWGYGDVQEWRFDNFGKWKYFGSHNTETEARAALEAAARQWLTPSLNKKG